MPLFARSPAPTFPPQAARVLFLDDDPVRAEIFLAENPEAIWVQTAAECIARLEERWDEVHLDHDLGGEHFVDLSRDDCGMEVVRWLCLLPRPHLARTRFHIHSHNPNAATMMGMQMMMNGFTVLVRPFGASEATPLFESAPPRRFSPLAALVRLFRRLLHREDYGYPSAEPEFASSPDGTSMPQINLDWFPPASRTGDLGPGPDPDAQKRA